ncbi:tetratricopeptide repeat protein [Paenibacillus assamensis]|uniref:tetratricopeptide repeat protein n=1 Tax=Paenibacillus assamensis TaxID=311244 RepID=UPI000405FEAC|nr:hypothetical protein [Paenibacillus assamensis]
MLQHMFATMNDQLDDILKHYPKAKGQIREELNQQIQLLTSMSDHFLEEWLRFEEKLALLRKQNEGEHNSQSNSLTSIVSQKQTSTSVQKSMLDLDYSDPFQRGQGYFTLLMYHQAANHFEEAALQQPERLLARAYLGLSYLHLGRKQEACRHFHFIIPLTEDAMLKALAYNALGCIQAMDRNTEKAQHYFHQAHVADPTIPEPIANLQVCLDNQGCLQLGEKRMVHMG